jgi:hypothetical protein
VSKQQDTPTEVIISVAGDPVYSAAVSDMPPTERDHWLRLFYAPEYRAELRRLMEGGVEPPFDQEDDEDDA